MPSRAISISERATVPAAAADVFDLLGDLDRHRELTDHGIRILDLQGPPGHRSGGLVELHGPAGLTRLAHTTVHGAEPYSRLWGSAETTDGARALLEWQVTPQGDRTHVGVRLDVRAHRWRDRLLLQLGGRSWLRARLRAALEALLHAVAVPPLSVS